MHGWLARLNAEQHAAVTHGRPIDAGVQAPPLLVIAGAGTGKTATLAHRVAWLVAQGVDPVRILLLTFSRRAAQEMIRRAERLIAQADAEQPLRAPVTRLQWAGTFHSVGARLLREYASRIGLPESFGILDRADAADTIDLVRQQLDLASDQRRFPRKDTCLAIYSHRVNSGCSLADTLARQFPWCADFEADLLRLFRAYVAHKQADGVLDYDDLLLCWDAMLADAQLAGELSARFDHILVDEYQDTNALQAAILLRLRPGGEGLTVVGDDAQAIYGFRAATVDNILQFPARFSPPATTVNLQRNYRSVQPVLDLANTLMNESPRRYPKQLRAERGDGARPRLVTVLDELAQVDRVITEVLAQREAGVCLKEQAVLFRTGHHSDLLEVELIRRKIPFVKYGGLKFLESTHIKDVLAILRWADHPRHRIAGFRCLQLMAGIGPGFARRCLDALQPAIESNGWTQVLARWPPPAAASAQWPGFVELIQGLSAPGTGWPGQIERVIDWYGPVMEQRFDDAVVRAADLQMLAAVAPQFASRERFLTELTLDPPSASGDYAGAPLRDEDYLILSTVHSAKGQEWRAVYVLNFSDGNFPNEFATGDAQAIEEERRLLYVAMTRARDSLQLIEPLRYRITQQARLGDRYVHGARSRFLTRAVLARLETAGAAALEALRVTRSDAPKIDVTVRLRELW